MQLHGIGWKDSLLFPLASWRKEPGSSSPPVSTLLILLCPLLIQTLVGLMSALKNFCVPLKRWSISFILWTNPKLQTRMEFQPQCWSALPPALPHLLHGYLICLFNLGNSLQSGSNLWWSQYRNHLICLLPITIVLSPCCQSWVNY